MKQVLFLLTVLWLLGCQAPIDNNRNLSLTVNYLNKNHGDTLRLTLEEQLNSQERTFSEAYQVPIRPVWDTSEVSYNTYKDCFLYRKGSGLFRSVGQNNSYYAGDILGHFKDFIWINDFMFKNVSNGDTGFVCTTYHDRLFQKDFVIKRDFSGPLNKIKIRLSNVKYDEILRDTLRTFTFIDVTTSHEMIEHKTYDSGFNLVEYEYVHVDGSISKFQILPSDYKKLKAFRENIKPMFKN